MDDEEVKEGRMVAVRNGLEEKKEDKKEKKVEKKKREKSGLLTKKNRGGRGRREGDGL